MTESTHPWVRSIVPMRSGLFVPIFDALANPALVARLSADAEEAGWDGIFLWDHVRGADRSRSPGRPRLWIG